jgi:branched-chain amino acid transport system substrate-binding protein
MIRAVPRVLRFAPTPGMTRTRALRVAKRVWLGMASLLLALALPAGPSVAAGKPAGSEVKFGAIVPSSGPFAEWGKANTIALQMLQDEVNASGGVDGVKLRIIVYDDGAKPDQSANLVRKLAGDDKVLAIAGPLTSSSAEVAFPVCNQLGIVCTSQASSKPGVAAQNRPWAFRNTVDEGIFAKATIPELKSLYHVKTAAIIYDAKDAVSTAIATKIFPAVLKQFDIQVLNESKPESFNTGDLDVSAQVTALKALKPDAVVIGADYSQAITVIREMKKQGLTVPIIGGSPLISSAILKAAPDIPIIAPATFYVGLGGAAGKFTRDLEARFKKAGGAMAATEPSMYDANITEIMEMYIAAVEKAGVTNEPGDLKSDRVKIRDYLTGMKDFRGFAGPISFNKNGDAIKRFYVVLGKDGKWTELKTLCSAPSGC